MTAPRGRRSTMRVIIQNYEDKDLTILNDFERAEKEVFKVQTNFDFAAVTPKLLSIKSSLDSEDSTKAE